ARRRVEAVEHALGAQRVNLALVEGGRGARAGAGDDLGEADAVAVRPDFVAGVGRVADDDLLLAALLLRVQAVADHRERRPPRPDEVPPNFSRRVLLPVGGEAHARQPTVALRPAEAWPVPRHCR